MTKMDVLFHIIAANLNLASEKKHCGGAQALRRIINRP